MKMMCTLDTNTSVNVAEALLGFYQATNIEWPAGTGYPFVFADVPANQVAPLQADVRFAHADPDVNIAETTEDVGLGEVGLDVSLGNYTEWTARKVNLKAAHDAGFQGEDDTEVMVIDTGARRTHMGLIDGIVGGFNYADNIADFNDTNGHGSHTAGICFGRSGAMIGGAPLAMGFIGKVFRGPSAPWSDIGKGVGGALARPQVSVTSNSYGGSSHPGATIEAMFKALFDRGTINICSAGNSPGALPGYPGRLPWCEAVSSTDENDNLSSFSTFGDKVIVSSPGGRSLSGFGVLAPGHTADNVWVRKMGTSMSAPLVAALAKIMKASFGLSPLEFREALPLLVADLGSPGRDPLYGEGRTDFAKIIDFGTPAFGSKVTFFDMTRRGTDPLGLRIWDIGGKIIERTNDDPVSNTFDAGGPVPVKLTVRTATTPVEEFSVTHTVEVDDPGEPPAKEDPVPDFRWEGDATPPTSPPPPPPPT